MKKIIVVYGEGGKDRINVPDIKTLENGMTSYYEVERNYDWSNEEERTIIIPNYLKEISGISSIAASFRLNKSREKVIFEKNSQLKEIGEYTFDDSNIREITIPKSCKKIGYKAFLGTHRLKEIRFEEGSMLEELGENVFSYSSLESIVIPKSCKKIGDQAFCWTDHLKEVIFEEGSELEELGENVFSCSSLKRIIAPKHLKSLLKKVTKEDPGLEIITTSQSPIFQNFAQKLGTALENASKTISHEDSKSYNQYEEDLRDEILKTKAKISSLPEPFKADFERKLETLLQNYETNLTQARPTFGETSHLTLEVNDPLSLKARLLTQLADLVQNASISPFYFKLQEDIYNLNNPTYNFLPGIKETLEVIDLLDEDSKRRFRAQFITGLEDFKNKITSSLTGEDEKEKPELTLEPVPIDDKFRNFISSFLTSIQTYTSENKDTIDELLWLENLSTNKSQVGVFYNYLRSHKDKSAYYITALYKNLLTSGVKLDIQEAREVFIETLKSEVDRLNLGLLSTTDSKPRSNKPVDEAPIKNITGSEDVKKMLAINSFIDDIRNDRTSIGDAKEEATARIEELMAEDSSLDEKLSGMAGITVDYNIYKSRLDDYESKSGGSKK